MEPLEISSCGRLARSALGHRLRQRASWSAPRELPVVVDAGQQRDLDLAIEVPRDEAAACTTAMSNLDQGGGTMVHDTINTGLRRRRGIHLKQARGRSGQPLPALAALLHVKAGELRAVVATAS